jgi:type III restriction/modification enzyme restriction subunit
MIINSVSGLIICRIPSTTGGGRKSEDDHADNLASVRDHLALFSRIGCMIWLTGAGHGARHGLFVDKSGLPSQLINQIKRLAAFQNPEFYKKQNMRLSTATTPRVIACAEDLPQYIGLPRGCRTDLEALLREYGISVEIEDQRVDGERTGFQFHGKLTNVQQAVADALLANDIGMFVAPPGVGKTVVGTYLVAARGCSTLVLVHRQPLLDQWLAQLSLFLGLEPKQIGQIGAGKKTGNGQLDVAMIQSLVRKDSVQDVVANYGQVIVDECHHPRLDTLFLAMPISWKGTLIQYAGRLHRVHPGKKEVRIFDYVDREVPVLLRMFQRRLRGYQGLGYARGEAPLGLMAPGDDLVVEYDEEAVSSIKERDDFL